MKFFTATLAPWAFVALTSVSAVVAVPNNAKRQSSTESTSVSPLTPSVTDEGSPLLIQWDSTTSQSWKSMEIKFITGSNQNMTELFTVATGVDGTTAGAGQLQWTAPNVSPNSGIYFFQFTHNGQEPTWTTRFAIADTNGAVTTPPNARQPEGPAIPWGTGRIVSGAVSASGSGSSSSGSSSSSASGAIAAASTSASSAAATSSSSASPSSASASSSSSSASNASQTSNTSSGSSSSSGSSNQSSSASTTVRMRSAAVVGGVIAALAGAMLV